MTLVGEPVYTAFRMPELTWQRRGTLRHTGNHRPIVSEHPTV